MLLDLFRNRFARTPLGLDRETALKGEKVFAAGRVLSVRESAPGRLEGEVEGSAGETYKTTVRLAPNGAVIRVSNECSCPVAFDCKHGAALLAGLIRCKRCGRKLTLRYSGMQHHIPRYSCSRGWMDNAEPRCIAFGGLRVDDAVEGALLSVVGPGAIAAATAAEQEAGRRRDQVRDALGRLRIASEVNHK
jgi:hypothetical protein